MTSDLWDELSLGVQLDDPAAIEAAIRYLEDDPWEFRSGYLKGRLMHHLANRDLTERQRRRLRLVLLRYCDIGPRWEFTKACRLARRQSIPGLRKALRDGLHGGVVDADVRRLRMLLTMRHPRLSERDRHQARRVLLQWAAGREGERWDARWVAPTASRLWPHDTIAALERLTRSETVSERDGARLLLRAVRRSMRRSSGPGSSAEP